MISDTHSYVVEFTCIQRAYDFERGLRVSGEMSFNEGKRMCQYFVLRTSQVILVVVETFLDLTIESREVTLSLGALGEAKG